MEFLLDALVGTLTVIKEWLPNLFKIFNYSEVAIGVSIGLMLIGLLIYLYLYFVFYIPTKSKLEILIERVKNIEDSMDMAKNFSYINNAMRNVKFVHHSWRELRKHFVFPEQGTSGPIRTSESPSDYFNMHTAEEGGVAIGKYAHVGESFVGIGLVFTFLGLVSGIYFAAQGLSGDTEQVRAGLTQLLDAATFKFLTSIAGVGVATFFTIGYKKMYNSLQDEFIQLSTLLEARIMTATVESVAFAQHIELKKQTQLLENLVTDLNNRIATLENNK